jgi:hypothetical protein
MPGLLTIAATSIASPFNVDAELGKVSVSANFSGARTVTVSVSGMSSNLRNPAEGMAAAGLIGE